MDEHEMTLGEYRDYCVEADARIASLTEAVRVLSEEMEAIKRLSDTSPTRTLGEASDNLMYVNDRARAALTTAKELTK